MHRIISNRSPINKSIINQVNPSLTSYSNSLHSQKNKITRRFYSQNKLNKNFGALNSISHKNNINFPPKSNSLYNSFTSGGAAIHHILFNRKFYADNRQSQNNLSIQEINSRIDQSEISALVNDSRYVYGVCSAQYAANTPIEDTYSAGQMENNGVLFGVFDGHAGDSTARFAQQHVLQNISQLLRKQPQGVAQILKTAFEQTDQQLLQQAGLDSGAVALVSYIDDKSGCLYTANAGDCGAVVGHFNSKKKQWNAKTLSEQHNTDSASEIARIAAEHPGEQILNNQGYLKGMLLPTRALGDFALKYHINNRLKKQLPSPPYITATPQVMGRKMESGDRFLIMASDGLWDVFNPQEAVQIVADMIDQHGESQLETGNAASYLIKQALLQSVPQKGSITERMSAIMSVPPEMKRRVHDDITVSVVFFKDQLSDQELQKLLKNVNADLTTL